YRSAHLKHRPSAFAYDLYGESRAADAERCSEVESARTQADYAARAQDLIDGLLNRQRSVVVAGSRNIHRATAAALALGQRHQVVKQIAAVRDNGRIVRPQNHAKGTDPFTRSVGTLRRGIALGINELRICRPHRKHPIVPDAEGLIILAG